MLNASPCGSNLKRESNVTKRVNLATSDVSKGRQLTQLSKSLTSRLKPSAGARPGRPSDPTWNQYGKLPMSEETVAMLNELGSELSSDDRKISPMQVAAHLLEMQLRRYAVKQPKSDSNVNRCAQR